MVPQTQRGHLQGADSETVEARCHRHKLCGEESERTERTGISHWKPIVERNGEVPQTQIVWRGLVRCQCQTQIIERTGISHWKPIVERNGAPDCSASGSGSGPHYVAANEKGVLTVLTTELNT
eukprot:2127311-Amphidinium_carterae.1